jgi:hypothetical protein
MQLLVGTPEGKRALRRPRHRWEYIIKMPYKELERMGQLYLTNKRINVITVEALYRSAINIAKAKNLHRISEKLVFPSVEGTESRCFSAIHLRANVVD